MKGMATLPQGNREPLMVKHTKLENPQMSLGPKLIWGFSNFVFGVSKSMGCD